MFLDTCFLIDIMRESKKNIEGPAISKLRSIEDLILNISLFTVCELMGGVRNLPILKWNGELLNS